MNKVNFGSNSFCGPSVISAVTGISTDEAEKVIQEIRQNNHSRNASGNVRGVWNTELIKAFNNLGYKCTVTNGNGNTLYVHLLTLPNGMYIFVTATHYLCIESIDGKRIFCDNHTKSPINAAMSARLGQRIEQVIKVDKI